MNYKHQVVNDLAWVFSAPMIVADLDLSLWWEEGLEEKLNELDRGPATLLDCVAQCKSHFLGAYFEVLFSFAIRYFSTLTVVFEHEQLSDENGKTLGEIDMLVKTPDGRFFQFEIAIKYFLEVKQGGDIEWIGPNKTDSLSKKSEKARAKQLRILETKIGRSYLEQWGIYQAVEPMLLIFGYLFTDGRKSEDLQREKSAQNVELNGKRMASDNENAYWIRLTEFKTKSFNKCSFYELIKPKWMTFNNIKREEIQSYESVCLDLDRSFKSDIRPKMYSVWNQSPEDVLNANKVIGGYPYERVFIVPDAW
ncbi:DUF1853 family protein [Marinomonas sp. 2405UD68-3]|uniref:DUF1853 family protein n=1 Tax=Marinomonas sp. 2405UD68-3 TaxID=3391835 RepID=UPI0039C99197